MIEISRYFENPFDDPQISAEELRAFAADHTGKLQAQDADGPLKGTFASTISETQAAFQPFDGALSGRAEMLGQRVGQTLSKNQAVQLFRTKIRQRQGRVRDVFGEGTPQYLEIFPQGLMYYTRMKMENAEQRMDYAVEKFTKYKTELGGDLLAEFTQLRAAYGAARDAQVMDKRQVTEASGLVASTRRTLELQ
ncbi:MAG: hypothetical protein M3Z36_01925, partial [Acidobacteriota bacterium]|nr:hypothetical protein [Acidobacteriota bacterium]